MSPIKPMIHKGRLPNLNALVFTGYPGMISVDPLERLNVSSCQVKTDTLTVKIRFHSPVFLFRVLHPVFIWPFSLIQIN